MTLENFFFYSGIFFWISVFLCAVFVWFELAHYRRREELNQQGMVAEAQKHFGTDGTDDHV